MSDMNMYNILGRLNNLNPETPAASAEVKKETIYESVEPRGSITNTIKSLESKYETFKEGVTSSPRGTKSIYKAGQTAIKNMRAATKEREAAEKAKEADPKKAFQDQMGGSAADLTKNLKVKEGFEDALEKAREKAAAKGLTKEKETAKSNVRTVKGSQYGGSKQKDEKEKDELDENRSDSWANDQADSDYQSRVSDEWAEFRDQQDSTKKEKEAKDSERYARAERNGIFNKPKYKNFEEGREFKNKDEFDASAKPGDTYKTEKGKVTKTANGIKHERGAAKEKDTDELDEAQLNEYSDEEYNQAIGNFKAKGGKVQKLPPGSAKNPISTASRHIAGRGEAGKGKPAGRGAKVDPTGKAVVDVYEKAPPGAKAERMVKHVKQGYSDDGKLTKREKGIAYATAWKAHNRGQVEEGTEFKDTIKNSAAKMTKAPKPKLKESALDESAILKKNLARLLNENTDLRKQPIYTTQEAWDHYAKELAEQDATASNIPSPTNAMPVTSELDEIAALAGLARTAAPVAISAANTMLSDSEHDDVQLPPPPPEEDPIVYEGEGATVNGKPVRVDSIEVDGVHAWDAPDYADAYITYAEFEDGTPLSDDELDQLTDQHGDLVNQAAHSTTADRSADAVDYAKDLDEELAAEGNEFSGALAQAKAQGKKDFEVDGKRYTVKEDIALSATGDDVVNLIRKLAGMDTVETEMPMPAVVDAIPVDAEEVPMDQEEPDFEVAEERDIEYTNTPREETAGLDAAIPSGNDMHRAKKSYSDKPYRGDNPMAVEDSLWESYESMIKGVLKK